MDHEFKSGDIVTVKGVVINGVRRDVEAFVVKKQPDIFKEYRDKYLVDFEGIWMSVKPDRLEICVKPRRLNKY